MPATRPPSIALALCALATASAAAQSGGGEFTAEERERLRAGELVRRPESRTEGRRHYVGGASWQRVEAEPERVWAAVLDVSAYPRLIPSLESARLVEDRGARRVLRMRHRYSFVTAEYHAIARIDRRARIVRFVLDHSRPRDIRDGRGFLSVHPYRGGSVVAWAVQADVGNRLLSGVFGPLLRDWILRVPWCVRGHLEPGRPTC